MGWDEHDESRRLLKGVSRICPVPEVLLAWEDGRLKVLGHPRAVELREVQERVLGVLDWEWRTTAQVIDSLGEPRPSDQQVRAALKSLAQEGAIERDPPISQGEARGRAHRWRLAPGKFSSNGNIYSANQTPGEVAPADSPLLREANGGAADPPPSASRGPCPRCGGPVEPLRGGRAQCQRCLLIVPSKPLEELLGRLFEPELEDTTPGPPGEGGGDDG
jgi:hypothetical protein